jgi:hypothetical protein
MRRKGSPPGLLFRLIIPATAAFIITIFATLAAPFGNQQAPIWKFLDRNGDRLLLTEFVVVILLTFFAMAWDRRQILKDANAPPEDQVDDEVDEADESDQHHSGVTGES